MALFDLCEFMWELSTDENLTGSVIAKFFGKIVVAFPGETS